MRFILYKFLLWVGKGKFYILQLFVSIITIKSLIMLLTKIRKMGNILYRVYYMSETKLSVFIMIISRV